MSDCQHTWDALPTISASPLAARFGDLPRPLKGFADRMLRAAAIATHRTDAGMIFQIHPDPARAGLRAWHWLVPARVGRGDFPFEDVLRQNPDEVEEFRHQWNSYWGEMIDIIAFTPDLTRPVARLTGLATLLGSLDDVADGGNIRMFSSLTAWFTGRLIGVCPVGPPLEVAEALRWSGATIVADNLPHAVNLQKLLRRPAISHNILVANG